MIAMTRARYSHLAISVADIERSRGFYVGALGFAAAQPYVAGGRRVATLMECDPAGFTGLFLRCGDVLVELLEHHAGRTADPMARAADEHGLAHISFIVDDLDRAVAAVEAHGGALRTRFEHVFGPGGTGSVIVFCTDPDGNRIELIQHADDVETASHAEYLGLDRLGWPAIGAADSVT